jgi:glycosyltransferase involved in cell wall biosynthesis
MLFSIVTVCLNPGPDLMPTVRSVLDQEFKDFELIIKDGGSTDGSLNALPSDPRLMLVRRTDSSIFDAMNQALALARGELVNFLNAGDTFVDPRVLSDVADVVTVYPAVPFFYGDVEKPQSRSGYEFYPRRLSRHYLFMNTICHQGWFVRRATYLAYGGFETEHAHGADPRLLLKMLFRDRLEHMHMGRVMVRYRGGGLSAQPTHAKEIKSWCDELKREICDGGTYAFLSALCALRQMAKRTLYDTCLWRLVRKMQKNRARRRTTQAG